MTKTCPYCGSNDIIVFDSNNDSCKSCKKWFPVVAEKISDEIKDYKWPELHGSVAYGTIVCKDGILLYIDQVIDALDYILDNDDPEIMMDKIETFRTYLDEAL